jgi:hypothetical protein
VSVPPDAFSLTDPSDAGAILRLTGRLATEELMDDEFARDEFVNEEFIADALVSGETFEAFLLSINTSP